MRKPPSQRRFRRCVVVSWYDNENSYVSQMVRTIKFFSELK